MTSYEVLLIGATGRTGRLAAAALLNRGLNVRALVRDIGIAKTILPANIEFTAGRLQTEAVIDEAVAGINAVLFTAAAIGSKDSTPAEIDYQAVARTALAAERAGVEHFVLMSSAGVTQPEHPHNSTFGNVLKMKLLGEESLRARRIPYTIVRALGLRDREGGLQGVRMLQGDRIAYGEDIARADAASFLADVVCSSSANGFPPAFERRSLMNSTFEIYNDARIPAGIWQSAARALTPDEDPQ